MEQTKGVKKHVVIVKFKDQTLPEHIDKLINDFANLVNLIEPLKSFSWGKEARILNMDQGFTHAFELTFENEDDIREYMAHAAHVDFANAFKPTLEKFIILDYQLTSSTV